MFKRLIYEDWTTIVPVISFIATAAVFFTASIRALLLPKERCEKLASLPITGSHPESGN